MKFSQKLTAIIILFLSTYNAIYPGPLDIISNLSLPMPEQKTLLYGTTAALALTGIGYNLTINRPRSNKDYVIDCIPWSSVIREHPYAIAGITAALGSAYTLHRNPEILQTTQEIIKDFEIPQKTQELIKAPKIPQIQTIINNNPALTNFAKAYLFNAVYATGVIFNIEAYMSGSGVYIEPGIRHIFYVSCFPYSYFLYYAYFKKLRLT